MTVPVVEQVGDGDRGLGGVELGVRDLAVGVDAGLLVNPQSSHFQALCEHRQGHVSCAPLACDDISEFHGFALSVFRGPSPLFRRAEGRADQAIGRGFSDISRKFIL